MANVNVSLTVNGQQQTVSVDSSETLLWMLRDRLGLTGTKYGCGIEQCRACSVLVNGQLEKACDYDVTSAAGKSVTTIEGLSADLSNKLQQAWITEQVPQCGYCQSGMIMRVAKLIKDSPKPTDAQIDAALNNICACGTYPRVRAAIKQMTGQAV